MQEDFDSTAHSPLFPPISISGTGEGAPPTEIAVAVRSHSKTLHLQCRI